MPASVDAGDCGAERSEDWIGSSNDRKCAGGVARCAKIFLRIDWLFEIPFCVFLVTLLNVFNSSNRNRWLGLLVRRLNEVDLHAMLDRFVRSVHKGD
jgi:hypothetical protein